MQPPKVLIVDDEPAIRFNIRKFLGLHGFDVIEADTCASGLQCFASAQPDAAIIDCFLPDGEGIDLVAKFKQSSPSCSLIVLTAHESINLAVKAIKAGAEHFLTKPVDLLALEALIKKMLQHQRLQQTQAAVQLLRSRHPLNPFVGMSTAIQKVEAEANKVVNSKSPVLLRGETGTGKGVLARWLYEKGPRADGPFVDLNCAALGKDLLESELFGHERGAFTSAVATKPGLLEVANHGTLFMDEIGDMDPQVQPKLLKVIEDKRFRRVGEVRDRQVDVQLLAATHSNLEMLVRENRFRNDLYFRINALPLHLPPLRTRQEDIPILAEHLLTLLAADLGCGEVTIHTEAQLKLRLYPWPGNIREMRNVLERAILISGSRVLRAADLQFTAPAEMKTAFTENASITLCEAERRHIERVLCQFSGRVDDAAPALGLSRSALYQKIKKHHIQIS